MTTISLREQINGRPSTPRSTTCVPVCHYRQKVTKGFHLSGVHNVSCNLLPLAGVSLLSRENSYIENNKSATLQNEEVPGDIKVNTDTRSGNDGSPQHNAVENITIKEGDLSIVGERLNSLSSLSCSFGTTPLIRNRKHTPDIEKPEMVPVGPDALSGKSISSLECNSPVLTPGVPPCSPIPNYSSSPIRRFASSPVKQFTLDGVKICGLAMSKSVSQPRDFISGNVRKVTYCCDKCELRMAEHEALLLQRSNSVSYHRYTPSSCQSNTSPIKNSLEHRQSSNELYDLKDLSQLLKYGREQQQNKEEYIQNRLQQKQSENRIQSKGDTHATDELKRDKSRHKEVMKRQQSKHSQDTSLSGQKGGKDKKSEEIIQKQKKEEPKVNKKNSENLKTEKKSFDTIIAEKSITDDKNTKGKVRIDKETQTPGQEPERKETGATGSESSKRYHSDFEHKQKEDPTEFEFKSEKYQSDSNLEMKMKMCREELRSASNMRKCHSDMFSESEALQNLFSSFKEKLLRLPKILNNLKLSNDAISLNSSTTEDAISSSETNGEHSSDNRRLNYRDCSSRLMGITSREKLQQILQDCDECITDTPGSFLPDISTPSRDLCYTAMVDKRYNRWKNRKRRKAKRYSPTPGDSSSEEEKVGGANNTATPIEMESEQRTYMRIRRRKRLPDDETNPHPVEYSEEYLHYDGSAEVTTSSSSDKDGRHSQFQEFAKYRQYQKQQQLSKTGHSNSSIESSASDKINVILNDKDEWRAWNEMRVEMKVEKKAVVAEIEPENPTSYFNNKPVAPPLISSDIVESPYVAAKDVPPQRPSVDDKVKTKPPPVPIIERSSKNLKIENETPNKIEAKLSNESSNRKVKFSRKLDVTTANDHGLFTNKIDVNSQKSAGNRKQAEAFARKQRQYVGELAWTSRDKTYRSHTPKSPQNAFENSNIPEKTFHITNTTEKKIKPKETLSQEEGTETKHSSHSVHFKNLSKNDIKKPKQKKSSGLDRRKCINMKKDSLPTFKPPKPVQQQRPQSHQETKKEINRTLSSLAFSPAFTFSFFELPNGYKNSNHDLSRRASTAFSKINLR